MQQTDGVQDWDTPDTNKGKGGFCFFVKVKTATMKNGMG